jgi:hypothetical protein
MSALVKGKNIDVSKVTFSAPKVLDNGAKLVYVNYNNGRFSVQTPWMEMPWKMGVYTEGEYPKYSIDLSFKGMDDTPELQVFHDKLLELGEKIIDGGVDNGVAWLKKKNPTREVVEAIYNPIVKVSKDKETGEPDGKWPPSMKLKVPRRDGTWECKVQDTNGVMKINDSENPVNLEDVLVKNTRVRAIMQCVGLWIASGNYMCQWKLVKADVEVPDGYANEEFLEDTDDEDAGENQPTQLKDSDEDGSDNADGANSADGNSSEDAEPSPEPEPLPPPPKKKVVRRVVKKKAT